MEKVRQHAVVASIEIREPGERLGPLADDSDGLLVVGRGVGLAVRLAVGEGEVTPRLAGPVIIEP
jgi:hypothetical protein